MECIIWSSRSMNSLQGLAESSRHEGAGAAVMPSYDPSGGRVE